MIGIVLKMAYRNIWRNPKRSLITVFAASVGIWSSVSLSSVARGLSYGMADNAINNLIGHVQIHAPGYLDDPAPEHSFKELTSDELSKIREMGARNISSRIRLPAVLMSERESVGVSMVGISLAEERGLSFIGKGVIAGDGLSSPSDPGIILGKKMVEQLKTSLGHRVVLVSQSEDNAVVDRGFKIVGIYDAELESTERTYVFIGRQIAQEFVALKNEVSEIALKADDMEDLASLMSQLKVLLPDLEIESWETLDPLILALRKVQDGFLIIWFLIVIIAVSFGVVNTQLMSIFERMREFGVMMAVGMKPRSLVRMVALEALVILFLGIAIGNILGVCTLQLFGSGIDLSTFAAASEELGFGRIVTPRFIARDWVWCNCLLVVIGLLSSIYPAWKGSRYDPVTAISGRGA